MLQQAMQFHQAGRLTEAENLYRQLLATHPNVPEAHNNLGYIHRQRGELDAAIACYRRATELRPDFAEAIGNLGEALALAGRLSEAIPAMRQAVLLRPDLAELHSNLANAYCQTGELNLALESLGRALMLRPDFAQSHNNLGNVYNSLGQLDQAAASYRRAIDLEPNTPLFHNNLAVTLRDLRQWDASITCARRALELQPQFPEAFSNLGSALACRGDFPAAETAYRHALSLRSDFLEPFTNIGHLLFMQGQLDQAAAIYRQVIARRPDDAQAHWSLGFILLLQGDYPHGWPEYEWRWQVKELRLTTALPSPPWDGADLHGRTILLQHEQGFGDTIQFARYIPHVIARGGKVILRCQPALASLLSCLRESVVVIPGEQLPPPHETWCPLLSLPRLLGTTVKTIPASAPYLHADPAKSAAWQQRLAGDQRLKVGLAWAGRPTHPNDRNRSIPAAALAPILDIPGIHFISLQKDQAAPHANCTDWTAELHDFSDTAALIANLDRVITVDTAVAHLAGALAQPVWLLLPFVPDWRWMLHRLDSPWYPTMRLFRQPALGDWQSPIQSVADELKAHLA